MTAIVAWDDRQLSLIRNTVAKDCNPDEFRQFVHICKAVRLDPLRRQIYAFVFNKDKPQWRQMTVVTSIGGYRSIAERTGNYRPDCSAPRFEHGEKDPATNPLGIVRCEVTVFKHSHGEWFPVVGEAWWDEYVPLVGEEGKQHIDRKKTGWAKMPRIMIAKCAEANALRKAWPDDFAMVHSEEEVDRAHSLDAWDAAEKGAIEARVEAIGNASGILIDWMDNKPLEGIPAGQFGDRAISFIRSNKTEPAFVMAWAEKNRHGLQQYWSRDKDGALALKQEIEKVSQSLTAEAAE